MAALATISHRGPDGEGVVARENVLLGHRRLSIIDLTEGGAQPMVDIDTNIALTFNGEIFNYLELRAELATLGHKFRSESDTEVLLRAYLQWGPECVRRLNGMFAFALHDPRIHQLWLVRDRFGVKPLCYVSKQDSFAFASEPPALIRLGASEGQPSPEAVKNFLLAGQYAAGEETFYSDIKSVRPAHYLLVDTQDCTVEDVRYWDYPRPSVSTVSREQAYEEFSDLFENSVRLRLRSDVPLGVSLSGGLDSTAILTAAAKLNEHPPICFTSTYGQHGSGELGWASLAAERVDATLVACPAPATDWLQTLTQCITHLSGPVATPAVVPLWHLNRKVRDAGITVLIEGQGADELLGGYVQHSVADFVQRLGNPRALGENVGRFSSMLRTFTPKSAGYTVLKEHFPWTIRALRAANGYDAVFAPWVSADRKDDIYFSRLRTDGRRGVDHRLWLDHSGVQLSRLLHYGDAISMAHGVESRMPFMDYRLVEWAFRLPEGQRIEGNSTKWLVREYLRRNGQEPTANRQDKLGYPTPITHWLADQSVREMFEALPTSSSVFEFVDRGHLFEALERQVGGSESRANLLFRIVTLQLWLQQIGSQGLPHDLGRPAATITTLERTATLLQPVEEPQLRESHPQLASTRLASANGGQPKPSVIARARTLLRSNPQLFWHSISYASNRGFPFLAAFAAARILGVSEFGEFVAATTFFATLILFADLGFSLATTTRVAQNGRDHIAVKRTLALSVIACGTLGLTLATCLVVFADQVAVAVFADGNMRAFLGAAALYVPAAALASVLGGGFAGLQKYKELALIGAIGGLAYVGLVVTGSFSGALAAAWGAAAGMAVRAGLAGLASWRTFFRQGPIGLRERLGQEGRQLAAIALPASIAAFAWMPTNAFIIAALMRSDGGKPEVAGFGAAMQIFTLVSVLPSVLTQFALPRLAAERDPSTISRKSSTLRYCVAATLVTGALAILVMLGAHWLLGTFGRQYAAYEGTLVALMICAILSAPQGILSNYLLAVGRNWTRVFTWYGWAAVTVLALALSPTKSAFTAAVAFTLGWGFLVTSQGIAVLLHNELSPRTTGPLEAFGFDT